MSTSITFKMILKIKLNFYNQFEIQQTYFFSNFSVRNRLKYQYIVPVIQI